MRERILRTNFIIWVNQNKLEVLEDIYIFHNCWRILEDFQEAFFQNTGLSRTFWGDMTSLLRYQFEFWVRHFHGDKTWEEVNWWEEKKPCWATMAGLICIYVLLKQILNILFPSCEFIISSNNGLTFRGI